LAIYIDQLGRKIELSSLPVRIISLVPSQTELLFHLGLTTEVVGITKFCIHPDNWFHTKTRIGGTKNLNIEKIKSLNPDLIIANKEENDRAQIEQLAKEFPVWISDIKNLEDAIKMIMDVGVIINKKNEAEELCSQIKTGFENYKIHTPNLKPKTCYLIWKDPYMTTGGDTFIHDMLQHAGFDNVFADKTRYPQITPEDLHMANCHLLILSSEPYPFQPKHKKDLEKMLPEIKVILADGEMFSWYGSRLLLAPAYFKTLHDEVA
jgi:ABC-type Fe3+-hydroxamate transport system substrate-binding protein